MTDLPAFERLCLRIVAPGLKSVARQLEALPPELLDLSNIPRAAPGMLAMWAAGVEALYAETSDAPGSEPQRART